MGVVFVTFSNYQLSAIVIPQLNQLYTTPCLLFSMDLGL